MRFVIKKLFFEIGEWKHRGRILAAFLFGIGICLKNSGVFLTYANDTGKTVQIFEPFIMIGSHIPFTMGILLGGILLLSDAPFIKSISEYEVVRAGYRKWYISEMLYVFGACFLYLTAILLCSCIFSLLYSNVFFENSWSDAFNELAYRAPEYAISKYGLRFSYPEFLNAVSPVQAVGEVLLFQELYMSLIGICMFVLNLLSKKNYGWIAALLIHILGYCAYANQGFDLPLRYSLLCCASPVYHYIKDLRMPVSYCLLLLSGLTALFCFVGYRRLPKSGMTG